jgi:hypothetical protein
VRVAGILLLVGLIALGVVGAQEPTPNPIDLTGTALVDAATQTAVFGPTRTPSAGTPTPLAGLCNSMTFRGLDDVDAAVEGALRAADLVLIEVDASAIEETEDCVTFTVQETRVEITLATLNIDDEDALGVEASVVFAALEDSPLPDLDDVALTLSFQQGNQRRVFDLPYAAAREMLAEDDPPVEADLLTALTWLRD